MDVQLDLSGLAEIQHLVGAEMPELVAGIARTMCASVDQLEAALRAGDVERAAGAAHSCRNDALIIGATQLLAALGALEDSARSGQLEAARDALGALQAAWPATLAALEDVAAGS
jgi:HPt (histidine-containing phosphotransfer) domain-containing protein